LYAAAKSEAEVTNNNLKDCARRVVLLTITTDGHEASRVLSATAGLLVYYRLTTLVTTNWSQYEQTTVNHQSTRTINVDAIQAQVKNGFTVRILLTHINLTRCLLSMVNIIAVTAVILTSCLHKC